MLVGADRETRPGSEQWDIRIVKTVTTFPDKNYTLITWEDGLGHETPDTSPAANPKAFVFRQRASLFGYNAPDWKALSATVKRGYDDTIDVDKSATWYRRNEWPNFEIRTINPPRIDLDADYPKILEGSWVALVKPTYVELYRAQVVTSHSRTDFTLTAKSTRIETDTDEHLSWFGLREMVALAQSEKLVRADRPITTPVFGNEVVLDELVDGFDEDDLDLVKKPLIVSGKLARYARVADLSHTIRTGTAEVPGQVPQLKLQPTDGTADVTLKVGDVLEVAGLPSTLTDGSIKWHFKTSDGVEGHLTLDADSEALEWQPADKDENAISEALFIKDISNSAERTTVTLSAALKNLYDRSTTKIHANVVATTHGETTKGEVLGSGDGSRANQRFKLKKSPVTYISASTASGTETTLTVRVNDVLWKEVSSLYNLDPQSQSYVTRIQNDGTAAVIFGDGKSGSRLPTEQENIKATYRSGIGMEGEVDALSLSLLKTRPLGIREVTNPSAASGAANPETLADARTNAPKTVLTLDRIVSLRDFEDFARAFAGISKAQATAIWQGENHTVHVTIASTSGGAIETSSTLYENLVDAFGDVYDPRHKFKVSDYEPLYFHVDADVLVDSRYVKEDVLAKVKAILESGFSFKGQALGQPITTADIINVMHSVSGVIAVDLNKLYLETDISGPNQQKPDPILPANRAFMDTTNNHMLPAQLLILRPSGITLGEME